VRVDGEESTQERGNVATIKQASKQDTNRRERERERELACFVKSLDCGRLERASCSSAQAELPVVRLQDQSSKGETSNSCEELWIARFITAIVENTTIRETEKQADGRPDR